MSSRKRGAHAIEERSEREIVIDGEDAVEEQALKTLFDVVSDSTFKQNIFQQATPKEVTKFQIISADAQARCVKTVVRLLIMKGGRRETISRTHIQDALFKVDPEYKKLVNAVLMKAADELRKVFGFTLVAGADIVGLKEGKKDDYYLTTAVHSKKVRHLIARGDKDSPFFGFMVLVLYSVLMAPGQKQACKDILSAVRQVEPRFPVDLGTGRGNTQAALAVPELGDDFLGLIRRMRAEHYLHSEKDEVDAADVGKTVYSFGSRFHVDIGKKQLAISYFNMMGQPVDMVLLRDIEKDQRRAAGEVDEDHS